MNTFFIRTLSGFIYAVLIIGSILTGPYGLSILLFLFLILSLNEFRFLVIGFGTTFAKVTLFAINILFYIGWMSKTFNLLGKEYLLVAFTLSLLLLLVNLFVHKEYPGRFYGNLLFSLVYLTIPLIITNQLFYTADNTNTIQILLGMFIIIWLNDTFAYITGALIGKHKLSPNISPKKTWEGAIGGFVFSLAGAFVLSLFFTEYNTRLWLGLAGVVVIFGTFGDLLESYLKRKAAIKESGSIMPGHGGILDRLDSLLLAAPFVYIYILLV
ncbi:MAG: phosphatidate cytidylyltransferase [Bacteroidales bacterium]